MGFLSDLNDRIRAALLERPLDDSALMSRVQSMAPARDFLAALTGAAEPGAPAVIAEVKRASPSVGQIADDADPVAQAKAYQEGGAAAISVLTEPTYFHGSLLDLSAVKLSVSLPVLRKDFMLHPSQLMEARAHGADAALLITASLTDFELSAMLATCSDLGLTALVEAHSDEDLERAIESGAMLIGVNARDLETLEIDFDAAIARLGRIPSDRVAVMESAISSRRHVEEASQAGASAILVGEALMRATDPATKIRELRGEENR